MVAVTGALVELAATNAAIFPVPLAGRPMDVLLFVQLKIATAGVPVKLMALVVAPLHKV